jgi:type I restriction enzyme S subunit
MTKIRKVVRDIENLQDFYKRTKLLRARIKKKGLGREKYAFEGKLTKEWRILQSRGGNTPEPAEKLLEQIKTEREKHYQKQLEDWKRACEQLNRSASYIFA